MIELFSLGELYVSDFLRDGEEPRGGKHELKLVMERDTGAVRLEKTAPLDTMFGEYWYLSNINESMRKELKNIVDSVLDIYQLNDNDIWIDLASNDTTMLGFCPKSLIRIGIDPIDKKYLKDADKNTDLVIQDYFSANVFRNSKFGSQNAKIISCIAMFYDLDKPDLFLQDVVKVLDDEGIFICQIQYSPLMISQCSFDNILHEHVYYYSLFNLKTYFERNGLVIRDAQINSTNGGSLRVYAQKQKSNEKKFGTQPYRDVCNFRVNSILEYEKTLKLDQKETWMKFYDRINKLKEQTVSFIKQSKQEGKSIFAYGASTKFNTILNYFGISSNEITAIAERNPMKWGLKTVGSNIPIVSEDEMRKARPDLLLLGPWFFVDSFKKREIEYLKSGGKFLVCLPKFEIIGLND